MTSQNMTSQPAEIGKIIWLEYIKAALRPMPILQAINTSYSAIHTSFKTFETRLQQIKLETWKVENTRLPKSGYELQSYQSKHLLIFQH